MLWTWPLPFDSLTFSAPQNQMVLTRMFQTIFSFVDGHDIPEWLRPSDAERAEAIAANSKVRMTATAELQAAMAHAKTLKRRVKAVPGQYVEQDGNLTLSSLSVLCTSGPIGTSWETVLHSKTAELHSAQWLQLGEKLWMSDWASRKYLISNEKMI